MLFILFYFNLLLTVIGLSPKTHACGLLSTLVLQEQGPFCDVILCAASRFEMECIAHVCQHCLVCGNDVFRC